MCQHKAPRCEWTRGGGALRATVRLRGRRCLPTAWRSAEKQGIDGQVINPLLSRVGYGEALLQFRVLDSCPGATKVTWELGLDGFQPMAGRR